MLRSHRLALFLAVAVTAAGCGADPKSADDEDTAAAQDSLDEGGPEGRRGPPMGGPSLLFAVALHDLDLSSEERAAVDQIAREARPPMPKDFEEKRSALAAAIRSGAVDPKALAPSDADMKPDHAAHRAKIVAALQKLHDALDADQRADLAERVTSALDEMASHAPPPPPEHMKGDRLGPMGMLLDGIVSDEAAKTRIADALEKAGLGKPSMPDMPSPEEMEAHMKDMIGKEKALARAFAADRFDAEASLPEPPKGAPPPPMGPPPQRFLEELQIVVPLLDANQRESLAARIEKGPPLLSHHLPGPSGGMHRGG